MTDKPTIFFSHSTKDQVPLQILRDLLIARTGGSIDIFMSSDGQSIPFGRNWVHEVERGLDHARLMFVFVTPNSVRSNWLYFEAGHAYSKGIRVVPVAMLGIDLSSVSPPLSLLQGFNISSEGGLGNIVVIANQEFGHRHNEVFAREDLSKIASAGDPHNLGGLGVYAREVDEITSSFMESSLIKSNVTDSLADAALHLAQAGIECAANGATLEMMGILVTGITDDANPGFSRIELSIDPMSALNGFQVIGLFKAAVAKGNDEMNYIQLSFADGIKKAEGFHRISGPPSGTDVRIAGSAEFSFRSVTFSLDRKHIYGRNGVYLGNPILRIQAKGDGSSLCGDLRGLLDLLFERRVLWRSS
jgi:hypothetical protein